MYPYVRPSSACDVMNSHSVVFIALLSASTGFAAVPLIDAHTHNGSFESGLSAPWLGDLQVAQDPEFASHGSWYAMVQGMPTTDFGSTRQIGFQFFPASPSQGRTFIATFDARIGAVGFDSLSVDFFARSSGGTLTGATEVPLVFPALSSSEWRTYQVQYQLPDSWDGDGQVSLQILFSRSGAVNGTTYVGYLDNVTLQAVPEPSIWALLGMGGLFTTGKVWFQRRRPDQALATNRRQNPGNLE